MSSSARLPACRCGGDALTKAVAVACLASNRGVESASAAAGREETSLLTCASRHLHQA